MSHLSHVSEETRVLSLPGRLELECGEGLNDPQVAFRSWGSLSPSGDNAVLVCHALTGSADVDSWWGGVLGRGKALDPDHDFIVASNVLGGCYGTTGPGTPGPGFPQGHGPDFPSVTIRDQVQLQARLLRALGVRRLKLVVGGSMGGMQALEWSVMEPLPVDAVVAVGAPARHSPWAIGLGEAQRQAIRMDPAWREGRYPPASPPLRGLALARAVAMCSYRSPGSFDLRFGRERAPTGAFQVQSYLRYQGEKIGGRFDPNSYLTLSEAMDTHDLGRGRGELPEVLARVSPRVLVVGIPTDVLYTPEEMETLARGIPGSELAWIESPHGHDAFLMEEEVVAAFIRRFRAEAVEASAPPAGPARVSGGRAERCA